MATVWNLSEQTCSLRGMTEEMTLSFFLLLLSFASVEYFDNELTRV